MQRCVHVFKLNSCVDVCMNLIYFLYLFMDNFSKIDESHLFVILIQRSDNQVFYSYFCLKNNIRFAIFVK